MKNIKHILLSLVIILAIYKNALCIEDKLTYNLKVENKYLYEKFYKESLPPVIFVPGDGGCQIEAKWNKPKTVHYLCLSHEKSWSTLWLSYTDLSTYAVDCFIDNMRLVYDPVTRKTSNSPGVEVRIPGFGQPDTIEYIDPYFPYKSYFGTIGKALVKLGYERNVTMRGAPFDFRRAPNELQDYYITLKKLIEETYNINNQLKVTLIAHSMGGPVLHYFLINQEQKWKDKYIASLIALSGAWGGSVKPIKVYVEGDDLGNLFISASKLRTLQISLPSLAFLLPSRELWSKDEILVQSPQKNYTMFNIDEFFRDVNFTDGLEMYKDTKDLLYNAPPPGVEIHCLHGVDVPTTSKLVYKNFTSDFPSYPILETGDGDGTVNKKSLEKCLRWARKQKQPIYHTKLPKVDHLGILDSTEAINYMIKQLKKVQLENQIIQKKRLKRKYRKKSHINSIDSLFNYNRIPSEMFFNSESFSSSDVTG